MNERRIASCVSIDVANELTPSRTKASNRAVSPSPISSASSPNAITPARQNKNPRDSLPPTPRKTRQAAPKIENPAKCLRSTIYFCAREIREKSRNSFLLLLFAPIRLFRGQKSSAPLRLRGSILRAYLHRTFDHIDVLQYLQPQVVI